MPDSTITQPARDRIVLFTRHIRVHFAQQLQRLMQAAAAIVRRVHRRMILDILAVIDGGVLDLTDRSINFRNGDIFMSTDRRIAGSMLFHPARRAQVRQGVQVERVLARHIGVGRNG